MSESALPPTSTPPAVGRSSRRSTGGAARTRAGSGANLYDWSREIPEWDAPASAPRALDDLPELGSPGRDRAARPAPGGPPRLTRRGRVVLFSLLGAAAVAGVGLLSLIAVTLGASSADASTENFFHLPEQPPTVVVDEGDTLWEIAERARPSEDPRKTVDEIVEINGLSGPVLEPGQELVLPSP
ncbi:LysM peptidoglycan-binding domain-containing protein [Thermobifida halotolerans]|uniref:LysM peptidoglycan-binding domain-containing protein n=1 Tax=Thermobifida halotolerans TaxID=483545 RepID=A0A399FYQ3_9ACTN|nr:LysM peptidoglycan-binding domain-containing protein [Thermobifida halotolerans]UOE17858.1 LysM peptidoglycan-binding domain-containing protein [Thermobifida halotolerans]